MTMTRKQVELCSQMLRAFRTPMTIATYAEILNVPSKGKFNARVSKLIREGLVEIVGEEKQKSGRFLPIYKSNCDVYEIERKPVEVDYGTPWLNKMFGVTKTKPGQGVEYPMTNRRSPPKKSPKVYVSGDSLSSFI